jgi:excisionase family DNA binding protein
VTEDRLLDAKEVGELLAVPEGWVREAARNGTIPHLKLGRYVRFSRVDLDAWMESLKAGGGPAWRKHKPTLREVS